MFREFVLSAITSSPEALHLPKIGRRVTLVDDTTQEETRWH
jgi:hypothetical protein